MASGSLPETHKALYLTSRDQPLDVCSLPTPAAVPGSATVKVLAAGVLSYSGEAYSGKRPYPFPTPLVPGPSCVGRIAAVGPDSTFLTPGQLVLVDATIRSRDAPGDISLHGLATGFGPGAEKLLEGEWRDGTFAEYTKVPLENCYPLNEKILLGPIENGGLGYVIEDLAALFSLLVPWGGFSDVNLRAGETAIVCPATGPFGSAAVRVAVAMGARVLAMGRNVDKLTSLVASCPPGRVIPIPLTSSAETDGAELAKHGPIDVYFDISPDFATGSHHVKTCINALAWGGRVSLMGGFKSDVPVPHRTIMRLNLTLKGTWMYTREQARAFVKLVESGLLKIGPGAGMNVVGKFKLEQWEEAFETASVNAGPGQVVLFTPFS